MKHNYSKIQYQQIAKETFSQILEIVPFISFVNYAPVEDKCAFGDFQAFVYFDDSESVTHFCFDVKSNGQTRYAKKFIEKISSQHYPPHYVFVAPYISEETASLLHKNKANYMDLSGNYYLLTKRFVLHSTGKPNQYKTSRPPKNYFSKSSSAASVIMRTMLESPNKVWQVKELSIVTQKALGTVSNVKKFLLEQEWAKELPGGFALCNIQDLLYAWAKDYPKKDSRTFEYYSLSSVPEIEKEIAQWNQITQYPAVLSSFSAAARYAPTVRYKKATVYVEPQCLDDFIQHLNLKLVDRGGNVRITIPHDETPCMFTRTINGDIVTSPVQTVLDLLTSGGRGEEAAEAIIFKEYK